MHTDPEFGDRYVTTEGPDHKTFVLVDRETKDIVFRSTSINAVYDEDNRLTNLGA